MVWFANYPMHFLATMRACTTTVVVVMFAASCAIAAEENAPDQLVTGLHRPCAIAARPGGTADRFELYFAEGTTGRVLKWSNRARTESSEIIRGLLPVSTKTDDGRTDSLALLFLDPGLLVVGSPAATEHSFLRTFELPDDGDAAAVEQSNDKGPKRSGLEFEKGNSVCALARVRANETVPDTLAIATRDNGRSGSLYKSRIQAGLIGALQRLGPNAIVPAGSLPTALTSSSTGRFVVAVSSDGRNGGSHIQFLHPATGNVELEIPTDLPNINSLAYSPTNGSLYAAAHNAERADADGIYRVDDASEAGHPASKTVKIAAVANPTALAFGPDAALYVTASGTTDHDGTLQVVVAGL